MTPELLIVLGVVLAGTGAAMVRASTAQERCGKKRARPSRRDWSVALVCAAVMGGVIAGLQWVLLDSISLAPAADPVRAVALGLPAFLAGATLVRLVRAVGTAIGRYRRRHRNLHLDERGGRR